MNNRFQHPEGFDEDRDARLEQVLRCLDPGDVDAGYWLRFHQKVMVAVRSELARRTMLADVTVPELVASWGRALVPTAALAAGAALFFMLQAGAPGTPLQAATPLALEEMLALELSLPTDEFPEPVEVVPEVTVAVMFASHDF